MKARHNNWPIQSGIGRPRSGLTRIAVGATQGGSRIFCATPKGSNVFLSLSRGLTPTTFMFCPFGATKVRSRHLHEQPPG